MSDNTTPRDTVADRSDLAGLGEGPFQQDPDHCSGCGARWTRDHTSDCPWGQLPAPPENTVTTYGDDDRCRHCGEHIANPHAPSCPRDVPPF